MADISVGQIIAELRKLKEDKEKLIDVLCKLEVKEQAMVEELHKFYNSPLKDNFEILIILKRPL